MSSDETRTKILNAAGPVFAELGLEKATVRDICRLASVNLASVNYHFGSKERLFSEVIQHVHQQRVMQNPLPNWPPGTPPEVRLRDFIANLVGFMQNNDEGSWEARLMRREMMQPTGACQQIAENFVRPHFAMLLSILDELLPAAVPLARRQQLGFSVIGQCVFYKFHREIVRLLIPEESLTQEFTKERLSEHIFEVVLGAVRSVGLQAGAG